MGEVEKLTAANILLLLQYIAPGFLIVYFRSLFVRRIESQFKDNVLLYATISVIFGFISTPILFLVANPPSGFGAWLVWFGILIAIPIGLGVCLGVATQKGKIKQWLACLNLSPLSPYRTGWDWAFSQTVSPTYILVTMDDGSQVAGLFGVNSLAASEHPNRDLFIEFAFDVDEAGNWTERRPRQSVLIAGKSIRYVEFFKGGEDGPDTQADP